jgi:ATP-dependent DNA helicase RecG
VEILDPLMMAVPRALNAILDDLPKAFHLPANGMRREDVPLLPRTAIREALVNAVMHRSYRHKSPVQIIRYANRLEIRNPGHSLVPDDRLGEPGSVTRNEKIAGVLHETGYAETKGSGIRSMRQAMSQAGLSLPTFESDREKDSFVVTFLFHHFLNADDVEWLGRFSELNLSEDEHKALVYARELGAINNASYRDINRVDTLVASSRLRHLRDLGLLEQKGKSVSTYYEPTAALLNPGSALLATKEQSLTTELEAKEQSLTTELEGKTQGSHTIAQSLGKRASPKQLREAILSACRLRPLSITELADLLGRKRYYLLTKMIRPMVAGKELFYTYPDNPTHPQQKYTSQGH